MDKPQSLNGVPISKRGESSTFDDEYQILKEMAAAALQDYLRRTEANDLSPADFSVNEETTRRKKIPR